MQYDVVVIGGGALGSASAYFLKSHTRSCSVAVIERDDTYALASTPRASGGVRRLFALPENIELSKFSIPFFEDFSSRMAVNGSLVDISFKKNGYLFIVPPGQIHILESNLRIQERHGVNGVWLDPRALKDKFPSMFTGDLGAAVFSPEDGWLDPYSVLQGFRKKAIALGVDYISDEVISIELRRSAADSVTLKSGRKIVTDSIVNAAGAWASEICAMVGMKVPITPMRRYEHYFEVAEPIEPLPYLKDPDRLAFRPEGKGYSGGLPSLKEPRGLNFDVDHNYFETVVWPALAHRFPQFERTRCKNTLAGLYDQNDFDGNPIIGPWTGGVENFYLVAGFSGHGLMHAPGSGRAIAELILDGEYRTLDLQRLGWQRIVNGEPYCERGIL